MVKLNFVHFVYNVQFPFFDMKEASRDYKDSKATK